MDKIDLLIKDGEVWTPGGFIQADVAVAAGKVAGMGSPGSFAQAAKIQATIDAKGKKPDRHPYASPGPGLHS